MAGPEPRLRASVLSAEVPARSGESTQASRAGVVVGLALAVTGAVLTFFPLGVAAALGRPSSTQGELINLRATWGGGTLGTGAFVAAVSARGALRPWGTTIPIVLLCFMAGVGAARAVGFVLDGGPDALQWFWLVAEVVIVVACAAVLVRRRRASTE